MQNSEDLLFHTILSGYFGEFSTDEVSVLRSLITIVELKKDEIFVDFGKQNKIGLIIKGSVYSYYMDDEGNEKISDIYYEKEKNFVFDYESYLLEKPLKVSIKANDNCTLIVANVQSIKSLYDKYPRFYQVEMSIVRQHFLLAIDRIKILQHKDPTAGLKMLMNRLPGIFSHFSYLQIASYLGIHRNTLRTALNNI